jgi:predicted permease
MLALGICANSTVFSWIDGTMLHPIPGARDTGNLVTVMRGTWNTSPSPPLSWPDYRDLRAMNSSFTGILAYHHDWLTLTGGDNPQRIYVTNTSANYFDLLGIKPFKGRFFLPDEEARMGGVPYIVLSYSLWQQRFASDPDIVGKPVEVAQHRFTVIGVASPGFNGCMTGIHTDAWMPLAANTDPGSNDYILGRGHTWLNVVGRLRPGVGRKYATQDLELVMRQLVAQYPNDHLGVNTITLDPLWRSPFGANIYMSSLLPILLALAGVVLLLSCVNIATLALVRFVSRRRETAIRQSLGASRLELMRQMIFEGLLVSMGGGALAILLTLWSSKSLARFIPSAESPVVLNGSIDENVIGAIMLLAFIASAISGALPAWRSSRVSPSEVLKEEAASVTASSSHRHLLSAMVVAQVALSLSLLVTAGLFLRTLKNAGDADPGFQPAHVLTASVDLGTEGLSGDEVLTAERKILAKVEVLPGVESAALSDWVPLNFNRKTIDAYPEGYQPQLHESMEMRRADVSAGYFQTMRIPVLEGREFTRDDSQGAPFVAILDQTAANHYWPGQDALGKRLLIWGHPFTVVGIAKNTIHQRVNEDPEPMVYLSYFQAADNETIVHLRTKGDPQLMGPAVERIVHETDARLPVFDVRPLQQTAQLANTFVVMETTFAGAFGILALILAASGIYGVVAYRTRLRTHEIGIRVALGASRSNVLSLVLRQGLQLTAFGLILGLIVSLLLTRFLRGLLYNVTAMDPLTVLSVTALLMVIAVAACYLPALKAMRIDPVTAIREN